MSKEHPSVGMLQEYATKMIHSSEAVVKVERDLIDNGGKTICYPTVEGVFFAGPEELEILHKINESTIKAYIELENGVEFDV